MSEQIRQRDGALYILEPKGRRCVMCTNVFGFWGQWKALECPVCKVYGSLCHHCYAKPAFTHACWEHRNP